MSKKKKIPFAIAYDFDGTLAPGNMQEYDFIPKLGIKPKQFWGEAGTLAKVQHADPILVYMHLMLKKAQAAEIPIRKADFFNFGKDIQFFEGVDSWFDRINAYGAEKGIEVQHYVISSGLREMIAGTSVAHHFHKIYASGFLYDHNEIAAWPALAINYTTKTQYLFRINKGSLEESDNSKINKFVPQEDRPVPFSHMVFIGDGETDIPCMRLVKAQGGHAIAVYPKNDRKGRKRTAERLVQEGRTHIAVASDYREGAALETAIKAMMDKVVADQIIHSLT